MLIYMTFKERMSLRDKLLTLEMNELIDLLNELCEENEINIAQLFYFLLMSQIDKTCCYFLKPNVAPLWLMKEYDDLINDSESLPLITLWVRVVFFKASREGEDKPPNLNKVFGLTGKPVKTRVNYALEEDRANGFGKTTLPISTDPTYSQKSKQISRDRAKNLEIHESVKQQIEIREILKIKNEQDN